MKKKVIRLDISYNGSNYKGYQKQKDEKKTIQTTLEKALNELYQEEINSFVAGRTDTGVHAIHQVISFKTDKKIPPEGLKKALNSILPYDIRVNKVLEEDPKFHARFSPKTRSYLFVIYNGEICPPFLARNVYYIRKKINLHKLKKSLNYFKGIHDFSSFCEQSEKENKIRQIFSLKIKKKKNLIFIYIKGNAFLRRMVRVIIGTAIAISTKKNIAPSIIHEIMIKKNRASNPFPTATPHGLYLYKIDFKNNDFFVGIKNFFKKIISSKIFLYYFFLFLLLIF